jgi:hypothetical protein
MAAAVVASPSSAPSYKPQALQLMTTPTPAGPQDVKTTLNYYKPNEDGSPPHPTYTDRPETYERPNDVRPVTVSDVRGRESDFTLDGQGFQFQRHAATEKNFLDDEKIKSAYYAELEQFLKDLYVPSHIMNFYHFC